MSHRAVRPSRLLSTICLLLACGLWPQSFQGQEPPSHPNAMQKSQGGTEKLQRFFRIDVEDATEAGLVEQQLKIKPALVRDRLFYYYGNEEINELLRRYGYEPVRMNPEDVQTRVVRVIHRGEEEDLSKAGVTILLREREYWIVRATLTQLRLLGRLAYQVEDLGRREPRPRQVRIVVSSREQVAEVGAHRVDIYSAAKSERGYVILGGAFDDSIDEMRAAGFRVEILADPPGVIR
ncbi:MAG TPA: hypothetical protein VJN92_10200 [Candidatus Acidoferrum sp.]|nr:hypothetical protein [Candidatus Acidoferrum sp.]